MSMAATGTVFVVDDEQDICEAIAMLMRSAGLPTRTYQDPLRFLADYKPDQPGCLLLDVRMPLMSGMELHQELLRRRYTLPVIFITGHGDVPMAVDALQAGATDFVQKPFKGAELIDKVQNALARDSASRARDDRLGPARGHWEALTPREREIAELIVAGRSSKAIAGELDISARTVALHRTRIMKKMHVRSVAQLVQLVMALREAG
jgi:FixJ family two-component response regulator